MKRLCDILRMMFDHTFWHEFIELRVREKTRIMYGYE